MSSLESKIRNEIQSRFVLIHHGTFWFCVIILLTAIVFYSLYIRLSPQISPTKCASVAADKEAKNIESILRYLSFGGLIITCFALLYFGLHYFKPLSR